MIPLLPLVLAAAAFGQTPGPGRLNQHRVSSPRSPAPEPGAELQPIPSLIDGLSSPSQWPARRREIEARWLRILGKVQPAPQDRRWFGDVRKVRELSRDRRDGYTRLDLEIPLERDFFQKHVLLIPDGRGPFPAVIAWSSSTPGYAQPEKWWGEWLVQRGFVVLTSWSFIRHYRDGSTFRTGAPEKVYERFGRWLPIGKMVHDARREAEYLRSLKIVDGKRIGFMGFSLGAKAAVYVAGFAPEIAATVAVDPHIAVNGGTNWYAPWYLDWTRPWPQHLPGPSHTVLGMLNPDPSRPGFEHDHHEVLALAAPRPFLLIGGSQSEDAGGDSDDFQSWGYFNRAREVYRLLGVEDRIGFAHTADGHKANGPAIDAAWQAFLLKWLRR